MVNNGAHMRKTINPNMKNSFLVDIFNIHLYKSYFTLLSMSIFVESGFVKTQEDKSIEKGPLNVTPEG